MLRAGEGVAFGEVFVPSGIGVHFVRWKGNFGAVMVLFCQC